MIDSKCADRVSNNGVGRGRTGGYYDCLRDDSRTGRGSIIGVGRDGLRQGSRTGICRCIRGDNSDRVNPLDRICESSGGDSIITCARDILRDGGGTAVGVGSHAMKVVAKEMTAATP